MIPYRLSYSEVPKTCPKVGCSAIKAVMLSIDGSSRASA